MKRADVIHKITNLKGEDGHKWVVDTYNSISPRPRGYKLQSKDPWCAATVSAVLHSLGNDDIAECSCPSMVKKAKDQGIWIENDGYTPEPGDIIMYDWQDDGSGDNMGNPDHVGFVVKVDDNKITVREGNKNGSVGNRTILRNGKFIRGYIVPKYEEMTDHIDEVHPKAPETSDTSKILPYEPGKTYTVSVMTSLNVRKGPGTNYGLVGYKNLTPNGKEHATSAGALKPGTKVTCSDLQITGDDVWMKIPSGWIMARNGKTSYVK